MLNNQTDKQRWKNGVVLLFTCLGEYKQVSYQISMLSKLVLIVWETDLIASFFLSYMLSSKSTPHRQVEGDKFAFSWGGVKKCLERW